MQLFVHRFEFSLKAVGLAARLLLSCAHDLPQGGGFGSIFFIGNSKIVYLNIVKYRRKPNLKH